MTVRTLVLLRHAKAANPERVSDADRPLTARGHADAAAAGAWLRAKDLRPGLVLCSPARRARETWHGVQVALGKDTAATTVTFPPTLYEEGAHAILDLIRETDPGVDSVLVVGHNPSVSTLSSLLDPAEDDDDGLRTAGVAVHEVTGEWSECAPGTARRTATYTGRG